MFRIFKSEKWNLLNEVLSRCTLNPYLKIGQLVVGKSEPYEYLINSIDRILLTQEEF